MTSKKGRQRGSRTHGGGTHKNRRGAGNRGGRGRAGRAKHEFHNYEPLGKHGFARPEAAQENVAEIDVRELDENATLYLADGLVEKTEEGIRIDTRDVVDAGHDTDVVKVLGSGQVRNELSIVADAFSDSAREKIEAAGGTAELSERGVERAEAAEEAETEETTTDDEDQA